MADATLANEVQRLNEVLRRLDLYLTLECWEGGSPNPLPGCGIEGDIRRKIAELKAERDQALDLRARAADLVQEFLRVRELREAIQERLL